MMMKLGIDFVCGPARNEQSPYLTETDTSFQKKRMSEKKTENDTCQLMRIL
jgi:hypothetical protein